MTTCVSLLSLFDFDGDRLVSQADWRRGTRTLGLLDMSEDEGLWRVLLEKFDTGQGTIPLDKIEMRTGLAVSEPPKGWKVPSTCLARIEMLGDCAGRDRGRAR